MNNTLPTNPDPGLEWIFNRSRQFDLLDRDEEKIIDGEKWRTVHRLLELLLGDRNGARFLTAWARNLLDNPPTPNDFSRKDLYYLLRREHTEPVSDKPSRKALEQIASGDCHLREKPGRHLKMGACFTVGIAELLVRQPQPSLAAQALDHWRQKWPEDTGSPIYPVSRKTSSLIAPELAAYYAARDALVNHNLRLVFSIAGKFKGRLPYPDLIQEGTSGLIRAAEKYRSDTGYRFSTYAYNWISQSVRRANSDHGAIIRFPAHVIEQLTELQRERAVYETAQGTRASNEQLAQRLDISRGDLETLRGLGNTSVSLDAPLREGDDGFSLHDKLPGGPFGDTDGTADSAMLQRLVQERMQILKPEERLVITRRWGLDEKPPSSRKDISEQMRVTTEWVRQLEVSALKKLGNDRALKSARSIHLPDR